MTQILCPSCGQNLPAGVLYCPRCSRRLSRGSAGPSAPSARPDFTENSQEPVPPLFAVSTRTFILMSLCTFGLYELYWCHQNWKRIRIASGEDLSPFWRTVFAPLWGFSLFRRIRTRAEAAEVPILWNSNLLATRYLLFAMARMLPQPWSLTGLFGFLAIIPVQRTAQRINAHLAVTGLAPDSPAYRDRVSVSPSLATDAAGPLIATLIAAFLGCGILMTYIGFGLAA